MVLIRERQIIFCVLCGCESRSRICFSCIKKSAAEYKVDIPFPDLNNELEAQIATFLLSDRQYIESQGRESSFNSSEFILLTLYLMLAGFPEEYFDEAEARNAIAHYMRACFGDWYHLISMASLPQKGEIIVENGEEVVVSQEKLMQMREQVVADLTQQQTFLARVITFLEDEEVVTHIKETRVVTIRTLIPLFDELQQKLANIDTRLSVPDSAQGKIINLSEAV